MAKTYYYLTGSLPLTMFGEKMPLTPEELDAGVRRLAAPEDYERFHRLTLEPDMACAEPGSAAAGFFDWEMALRNAWLELRKKNRPDAAEFKRGYPDFYSEIVPGLTLAAGAADPLEAEKIIDRMRWSRLDELEAGHRFDFDYLCLYKFKLLILNKYQARSAEAGQVALDGILAAMKPPQ